jgi:N4-gp56 family major capsid protein
MADFTVGISGTAVLDDSIVQEFTTEFIVEYNQVNVMDQFVEFAQELNSKSISMPRYSLLSVDEGALTEKEDPDSSPMADSEILITPLEYGKVITATSLADIQTAGRASRAAVRLIGQNMASARNVHATRALEATSNVLTPGGTAEASLVATDVMSSTLLNKVYNKLARANVPKLAGNAYVAFMHDDTITDIRASADWVDVAKYSNAMAVLSNEVGMFRGFRIITNNDGLITADAGAAAVDTYRSTFLGANGLGLAQSKVPQIVFTSTDKLNRMMNVGWYGVYKYSIIEPAAVYKTITASSVGAN